MEDGELVNYIMFHSPTEAKPQRYEDSYTHLRAWVDASLDLYKSELISVLFPIFLHCYLDLVTKNFGAEAKQFMERHRARHEASFGEELQNLTAVGKEQVAENELASLYRKNKYNIRMSSYSFELLISFLQDMKYMLLLRIVNQYINIQVFKGAPLQDVDESNLGVLTGVARGSKSLQQEIQWGVLPPPRKRESELDDDETAKKKAAKKAKPEPEKFESQLSLPGQSDELASEILQDFDNQITLGSDSLPSCCFFSFLNTHQTLQATDIGLDASVIVGGFADSTVRVWNMDPRKGNDDVVGGAVKPPNTKVLVGHSGPVYSVSLSPDRNFVLSSSEDHTARLWSLATGTNLVAYKGHNTPVWDVRFAPVGFYFATASHDCTARLWSTDHVYPLRIFAGHLSDVDCVQFHPNCNYVATGSSDKTVRMWDVNTGNCVRLFTGHTRGISALAFSHDGKYVASASHDRTVRIWDLGTSKVMSVFCGHAGAIWSVDFSAEGTLLATGGADNSVRLWDAKADVTGKPRDALAMEAEAEQEPRTATPTGLLKTLFTKTTPVQKVVFTRRNQLLAAGPFTPSA
eukprot:TRINITY_DN2939_c0_g1_i1.p1 TRINITY_DN2939_c0_g1~~TRINITY_DN2939_c0_g1_i1.p1  ORF type:complete len:632 (+),score=114.79 TRINITY_DN2939_c0_g1_i1:172-1896(+)